MADGVTVACDKNQDPPVIQITIVTPVGPESFVIPKAAYDMIAGPLGYPLNPCGHD